ncbi:HPP family protein [uncultured Erythrobacter sp.]|uniref:HPP family protein n=1 Tax=uncultured Erythrobacter sp. TaxID=263913 RepID=UPI00265A6286|nr:HPP family protein [uncultured Erythrobacter sp.]
MLNAWRGDFANFLLIAPLGASAFLLFAIPNSPLAQPFSAIMGNTMSALVAIAVLQLGLPAEVSVGLAVGGAIFVMAILRAMHPPGGAVALATVLIAVEGGRVDIAFALSPVLLDTALLVLLAVVYNRLTGRRYPFRQAPEIGAHQTGDAAPDRRLGLAPDVLERVLSEFNLGANIGAEDFGRILAAAEAEAARRHFAGLTCGEVMSKDIVSVAPDTSLVTIADLFRKHHFKTLPVVDADRKLKGIISQNDLIQRARSLSLPREGGFAGNLRALLDPANRRISAQDIMTANLRVVRPEDGVGILVQLLADGGVQAAPVVKGQRLVGIVTRSDLLAVLAHQTVLASAMSRSE